MFHISSHQPVPDRLQLPRTLDSCFGIVHPERFERIDNDLGYDQPRVLFVVGRHYIPGRVIRAGRAEALLVGRSILLPELSLLDVGPADLPVLVGFVDTRQEPLQLFLLREMEEELDDEGSIGMQVAL
jgi:hypothetical protein